MILNHNAWSMFSFLIIVSSCIASGEQQVSSSIESHSISTTSGIDDDLQHECVRDCSQATERKKCFYNFHVEWYITMSKACFDCPFNVTDCQRPHCVSTDGYEKPIVTVNRRIPGPSIHVCERDEIIVDIVNDLGSDSTAIHWHGVHQRGTQYMDGVPFITQCPIIAGTSFRYHFLADLAGTHYWHSHSGFQRTDGMFGSMVIRSRDDPHKHLYDVDDPKHLIVLTDWMDGLGIDKFVNHHHTKHDNKPYNLLLNGIGRFQPLISKNGTKKSFAPIYEYNVLKGLRYRFRSVSNSIQNCPIEISVDGHSLLVIASDAHELQPQLVESLVIYGGERFDFVVNANKSGGVYWIKFRGLLDCDERFKSAFQVGVIRYDGYKGLPQNLEDLTFESTRRSGLQLNKLNAAPGDLKNFLTAADVRSHDTIKNLDVYKKEPKYKFWLEFDFYSIDNDLFHHSDLYPFFGVEKSKRLFMPQINGISLKLPNAPPLSQLSDFDEKMLCNASTHTNCADTFCHCTHTLQVELGSLVEVILVDRGIVYWANHPFHLHGHAFAVLGMERLGEDTKLQTIKDLDAAGKLQRNFENPPIKDTVTVPDGGYTVIRFIADNPGYWLFHCHIAFHMEVGMGLVFKVGDGKRVPPVPKGFPKCQPWLPEPMVDLEKHVKMWSNLSIDVNLLNQKNPYEAPYKSDINEVSQGIRLVHNSYNSIYFITFFILFCYK